MTRDDKHRPDTGRPEKGQGLLNIVKLLFLAAILIVAWFVLDRLISGR